MSEPGLGQPNATAEEMKSDAERAAEVQTTVPDRESAEFQLTPEIEAMVMEKVQDINRAGVASSSIGNVSSEFLSSGLTRIFNEGLLGVDGSYNPLTHPRNTGAGQWSKSYREHQSSLVYFNIMGRSVPTTIANKEGLYFEIDKTADWSRHIYTSRQAMDNFVLSLIFNLKKFQEVAPVDMPERNLVPRNGYAMDGFSYWRKVFGDLSPEQVRKAGLDPRRAGAIDIDGNPVTFGTDFGFVLNGRISPKIFEGLMITVPIPWDNEEPNIYQTRVDRQIHELIKFQINNKKDNPMSLLPIYEASGDLLWPKQMSYEEVKAFVVERDARKAAESQSQVTEVGQMTNVENNELDSGSSPE